MAQCVGFFHNPAGSGRLLKKSTVVGRIGSGRSVEIFNRVFPGTLFTLGQGGRSWQAFGERKNCFFIKSVNRDKS